MVFVLDAAGYRISGPTMFVEYAGTGRGTAVGLACGPDGLYFTGVEYGASWALPSTRRPVDVPLALPLAQAL